MEEIKIVADSSSDIQSLTGAAYAVAPLKIITTAKEYVDDAALDVEGMVQDLLQYKGQTTSACPSIQDWIDAFGDAKRVICVTITDDVSGAYNSACIAAQQYEEEYPDRKVFVLNSYSTATQMYLIVERLREEIQKGTDYETLCERITDYRNNTGFLFILQSVRNLANNGRVSHLIAKAVGLLGIRILGTTIDGKLQMQDKCRGEEKAYQTFINMLKSHRFNGGKVSIAHCQNPDGAKRLKERILDKWNTAMVEIHATRGLCSFYAEHGGLLIGFEKA